MTNAKILKSERCEGLAKQSIYEIWSQMINMKNFRMILLEVVQSDQSDPYFKVIKAEVF